MSTSSYHLAQVNIARARAEMDSPEMAAFAQLLEPINRLADQSPGFVWRLQTEEGDATSIRVFEDTLLLVNMSVWESIEALRVFVYQSRHLGVFKRRAEWFHPMAEAHLALWWIPAGTLPDIEDAKARIEHARAHGPTPFAFTFTNAFPASDQPARPNSELSAT